MPNNTGDSASAPSHTSRRRKGEMDSEDEVLASISSAFQSLVTCTRDNLRAIASRVGYEVDARERRMSINNELKKLYLTLEDRVEVCMIINKEDSLVDTFLSFTKNEERRELINILLKRDV